jgi:hypothetical protein
MTPASMRARIPIVAANARPPIAPSASEPQPGQQQRPPRSQLPGDAVSDPADSDPAERADHQQQPVG